jgi:hypothetical protein
LDLTIGGKGLSIVVNLEASPTQRLQVLPHYVRVHIDRLKMRFHSSGHDGMYAVAAPFIGMATKKSVETAIAQRIVQGIDLLDDLLYRLSKSA